MAHGHSAIDNLIASTALRKYQEGGEVSRPGADWLEALQLQSTFADKTAVASGEEDPVLYAKQDEEAETRRNKTIDDFTQSVLASSEYKKGSEKYELFHSLLDDAVRKVWEQSNRPFIRDFSSLQDYNSQYDPTDKGWIENRRAFFKLDERPQGAPNYPVDTLTVPSGNLEHLLAEIAHAKQFGVPDLEKRKALEARHSREKTHFGEDVYRLPGTVEYEAHSILEPEILKQFLELSEKYLEQ